MKPISIKFYQIIILLAIVALGACKAKKAVVQPPAPVAETPAAAPVQTAPAAAPVQPPPPPPAPPVDKPDYNFANIQFEFNSGILKTEAYPLLDKIATEMKKDPSAKFNVSGYASAEGTDEHNMQLSIDRANAVKVYLFNTGISADNLMTKGYGEANPVADNSTEAGRVLNRRVEIRKVN